jgi:1-deoxy-D-xylulose-5-phosphate synthase
MSVAKSLKEDGNRVIAVIGDGSMTAGLAFEGLNQAGHLEKDLIVVLNDNEMSISPNVGALSAYLNRIMTGQLVNRFRRQLKSLLQTIPGIGNSMVRIIKQAEESFKGFLTPGMLFEELGFKYVGPIDGHHIDQSPRRERGMDLRNLTHPPSMEWPLLPSKRERQRARELAG